MDSKLSNVQWRQNLVFITAVLYLQLPIICLFYSFFKQIIFTAIMDWKIWSAEY